MQQRSLFDAQRISEARVQLRETQTYYGPEQREQVMCPDDVAELLWHHQFSKAANEKFVACMLNTSNVVQTVVTISEGSLSSSVVTPREVFQAAILDNAAALIVAHNHPSGNPEPSREDIKITRQLAEAGETLGIPLHDSIIVIGESQYTSLADRGVLS